MAGTLLQGNVEYERRDFLCRRPLCMQLLVSIVKTLVTFEHCVARHLLSILVIALLSIGYFESRCFQYIFLYCGMGCGLKRDCEWNRERRGFRRLAQL